MEVPLIKLNDHEATAYILEVIIQACPLSLETIL